MQQIILGSLIRQAKGTELLCQLLREEYSLLRAGKPDQVTGLELCIQDLIRQLVREREALISRLHGRGMTNLAVFLEGLSPADRRIFETWRAKIITHEQDSGHLASINADLASYLPEDDPVLAGGRLIFQHHPALDTLALDISQPTGTPDPALLVRAGDLAARRLRNSRVSRRAAKATIITPSSAPMPLPCQSRASRER